MMEERILTDEEIVKALENCNSGYGAGIVGNLYQLTLDFIHRLREENEFLKAEKQLAFDTVKGYSLTDIEQKAEIERLKNRLKKPLRI